MGIIYFCFQMGGVFSNQCQHTFPPACQHIMQESGRSTSNTTASLVLCRRTLPNDHYSGPSCWAITVHWCGTFAKQHIHLKWNVSCTELWNSFTMMLAPAMKNCLPVPSYQPWNCIVKGKFLWKCSNMLTTFHHNFIWGLFKVKDVNYNLQNNRNVCSNHCQTKKYGLDFLHHGAQATYGTCYQMKWMNIKLGNYKASIRNWNEPMWYMCAIIAFFSTN